MPQATGQSHKKDAWDKLQILANCIALVLLGILGTFFESSFKSRELNLKYISLAVEVLRLKPEATPTNLRKWAIDIVNRYSSVPLPSDAQKELMTNPFPSGKALLDEQGRLILDENGKKIITNQ